MESVGLAKSRNQNSEVVLSSRMRLRKAYETSLGIMFQGTVEKFLASAYGRQYKRKIQLILTSPPFPLNRKKAYGNLTGDDYVNWLGNLSDAFKELLTDNGSMVIEIGNAWEKGKPTMSTLPARALMAILEKGRFNLCQEFIYFNQARLPSPAQWVNIERIRIKDAFTHIWWMSPTERPKADNRNVLKEYSPAMRKLLSSQKYNSGKRPSEHHIGEDSFLRDNRGAIPPNVLTFANTSASGQYQEYCRTNDLKPHPSRMVSGVADFFIRFLTDPGDIVLDPFAGSNTTGSSAENLKRGWISIEPKVEYVAGSKGRFAKVRGY